MAELAIDEAPPSSGSSAWKDVALLLMEATATSAVRCGENADEVESFQKLMGDSIAEFRSLENPAQVLTKAGELSQAIARYYTQAQNKVDELLSSVALSKRADRSRAPVPTPESAVDATTGLLKRPDAEAALTRALEVAYLEGMKAYAVVFYLHRMPLTNARFGEAIGNQVILFCSQHIATTVTRVNDSLYRWSGPTFVAILERTESESAVNSEVQRILSAPFSRFFETSSRSVYLPVKITAEVIPLYDTDLAAVTEHVERFVLKSAGQTAIH